MPVAKPLVGVEGDVTYGDAALRWASQPYNVCNPVPQGAAVLAGLLSPNHVRRTERRVPRRSWYGVTLRRHTLDAHKGFCYCHQLYGANRPPLIAGLEPYENQSHNVPIRGQ